MQLSCGVVGGTSKRAESSTRDCAAGAKLGPATIDWAGGIAYPADRRVREPRVAYLGLSWPQGGFGVRPVFFFLSPCWRHRHLRDEGQRGLGFGTKLGSGACR